MGETVKLLAPMSKVFIPDKFANCPMAAMINEDMLINILNKFTELKQAVVPLLYVNSTLTVKFIVGKLGGLCCTSSNVKKITSQLLKEKKKIFFLPDKNLALNCVSEIGVNKNEVCVVDKYSQIKDINVNAKIFIWKGFCIVHTRIKEKDIKAARNSYPQAKIIVHPECDPSVVQHADFVGSTTQLLQYFLNAPSQSIIIVGTELRFIERLPKLRSDIKVYALKNSPCLNMAKITPHKLLNCISKIVDANKIGDWNLTKEYEITILNNYIEYAHLTLKRMIEETEK